MNKVIVRAPVRADLAGGTLDLWPIYLFHPGSRTVNVAISYYAESEVCQTGRSGIDVYLTDLQYRQHYASLQELASDPKAALIFRAVEHFHLDGISITTRTDAPRGSGLGGSSALTITLVRALSELAGIPVDGEHLVFLVRDLETRLLGVPAGIQDYYPPVFGGLASLRLDPGMPHRHPLATPVAELERHMLLHYTGVAHFSGTNNWEMYKRQIEGKKKIQKGFSRIAGTAVEMERALEAGNFQAAGKALAKEWQHRKALIDGISTPEIEAAIEAATAAGAWGGKVCGAGGGGCIVFLFPPDKRDAIIEALGTVPGKVLDAVPVAHGLTIQRGEDAQSAISIGRAHLAAAQPLGSIEQLYVHGETGEYKPFVLAEAFVTHTEGRSGTHHAVSRAYMAPIATEEALVLWHEAKVVDPQKLDMRTVPELERATSAVVPLEAILRSAPGYEESFRRFLEETERLLIYHNPAFGLFSEANESHDAFAERCLEEANRRIAEETERLESTFRRRIDQLRERSDREERKREASDEEIHDQKRQDVNVAWGQTLYNITSGKPATVAEPPQSVREGDYMENIAQIQKAWDRELQNLREEVLARAGQIEEISIAPVSKNIEVKRSVVLWAGKMPEN